MSGDAATAATSRRAEKIWKPAARTAMENLLAIDPDVDVVYTINEINEPPAAGAAAGAHEALRAVGRDDEVMIVSVDGGCPGVQNVAEDILGATSQQYPLRMAELGIEAIAKFAADGTLPQPTEGKDFTA